MTKKEVAGQTINYSYNADNLIESEVSSNGTSKTYTYDALMRLKTMKETNVDGKWLKKHLLTPVGVYQTWRMLLMSAVFD